MSVFTVPKISIGEIKNLEKVKLYLAELNKKIRFLSENVDGDNIVPSEYQKFYQNEEKAVELVHSMDGFTLAMEDHEENARTAIEQTSRALNLYVKEDNLLNEIKLSSEKIVINGTGLEVDSKNFKLDNAGNLKLSGSITAESGNFGSFQIVNENGKSFLRGNTIDACGLGGTIVNVRNRLDITTDKDITGCYIDFSNCKIEVTEKTYFGWFACDDVVCGSTVYANCGQCRDAYIGGRLSCYDIFSNDRGIAWSDRRVKKDIKPIDNALEYILSLRPVSYKLKDEEGIHYGLVAQEILSGGDPFGIVHTMENGYYCVNYEALHGVITKAIQELKGISDDLQD